MEPVQFTSTMNQTTIPCQQFPLQSNRSRQQTNCQRSLHIWINNLALNPNTAKICIPEIFNSLLGADRPSDRSVQMVEPDLPQSQTHLAIASNRFSRAMPFGNFVASMRLDPILQLVQEAGKRRELRKIRYFLY